jgi:hypothetical protein
MTGRSEGSGPEKVDFIVVVKDAKARIGDRSDRQQANSKKRQVTREDVTPSPEWSPAARLLSGPGRGNDNAQQGRL